MKQRKTDIKRALSSWGFIAGIAGTILAIVIGVVGEIYGYSKTLLVKACTTTFIKADTLHDTYWLN